mmetsp:Transcript_3118/g.4539  ORF Transcript_3118/g.4539 Transcript_3118/m.4539 type:complete len:326 (-) Transcript_3118:249-1226(-)
MYDLGRFNYCAGSTCKKGQKTSLSWKLDPKESLSDYKIVVMCGEEVTSYHVHRNILAVGPRRSEYFVRLFQSDTEVTEHKTGKSSIQLEEPAACAFPLMLDYMYNQSENLESVLTTENAISMRFLASYFGVEALFDDVNKFIQKDLIYKTAPAYVTYADFHHDEKVLEAARALCADNVCNIEPAEMALIPLKCFRDIVCLYTLNHGGRDIMSSHIVAACQEHTDDVDQETLLDMTSIDKMPAIAPKDAMYLFHLSLKLSLPEISEDGSTLHERCIKAMAHNWLSIVLPDMVSNEDCTARKGYHDLSSDLKVKLLEAALCVAGESR